MLISASIGAFKRCYVLLRNSMCYWETLNLMNKQCFKGLSFLRVFLRSCWGGRSTCWSSVTRSWSPTITRPPRTTGTGPSPAEKNPYTCSEQVDYPGLVYLVLLWGGGGKSPFAPPFPYLWSSACARAAHLIVSVQMFTRTAFSR